MIGILRGLQTTLSTFLRRPVTVQYPDERLPLGPRFRGFPGLLFDAAVGELRCTGCGVCQRNCPNGSIRVSMKDNERFGTGGSPRRKIVDRFDLNLGRCMLCGICVEVCEFNAIRMTPIYEAASYSREELMADRERLAELMQEAC